MGQIGKMSHLNSKLAKESISYLKNIYRRGRKMDTLSALFATVHTNSKVTRTNHKSRITKRMAQVVLAGCNKRRDSLSWSPIT